MTICTANPPTTLDGLLGMIQTCAQQYGGADWPSLALTGLGTVVVLVFALLLVGAVALRVGR
jgi:hypothetical protein